MTGVPGGAAVRGDLFALSGRSPVAPLSSPNTWALPRSYPQPRCTPPDLSMKRIILGVLAVLVVLPALDLGVW